MNKNIKILMMLLLAAVVYFGIQFYNHKSPQQEVEDLLLSARKSFGNDIILFDPAFIGYKIDS